MQEIDASISILIFIIRIVNPFLSWLTFRSLWIAWNIFVPQPEIFLQTKSQSFINISNFSGKIPNQPMSLCRREENLLPAGVYQTLSKIFKAEVEIDSNLQNLRELLHKLKVSDIQSLYIKRGCAFVRLSPFDPKKCYFRSISLIFVCYLKDIFEL